MNRVILHYFTDSCDAV